MIGSPRLQLTRLRRCIYDITCACVKWRFVGIIRSRRRASNHGWPRARACVHACGHFSMQHRRGCTSRSRSVSRSRMECQQECMALLPRRAHYRVTNSSFTTDGSWRFRGPFFTFLFFFLCLHDSLHVLT